MNDKALTKKDEDKKAILLHIEPVISEGFAKERFAKMAIMALTENPVLAKVGKVSLYKEMVRLARMGLIPDGREAALVPFFNNKTKVYEAQAIPMVGGLIKNARKSGEIKSLGAFLVYENDEFEIRRDGSGQGFTHVPVSFGDRGELVGVYGVAYLNNGAVEIETLDLKEIAAIEKSSKAKFSPWKTDFRGEMIRKSVLRRLLKRLPTAGHLDELLSVDNENYDMKKTVTVEAEPVRPRSLEERLDEASPDVEEVVHETPPTADDLPL